MIRKLKKYKPTRFMLKSSHYDSEAADIVVAFIEQLKHTKGEFYKQPFELIDWQEQIIRDVFGVLKPDGYRQFNTVYIEVPKNVERASWRRQSPCICSALTASSGLRYMAAPPTGIRPPLCLTSPAIW